MIAMNNKVMLFCLIQIFNLSSLSAQTKLSLCNGIWTTKSCDQPEQSIDGVEYVAPQDEPAEIKADEAETKVESSVEEKKATETAIKEPVEKTPSSNIKSQKDISSILHPLNMKVSEIKSKYNKAFDISQTHSVCKDGKTSIEDCKKAVSTDLEKARDYEIKLEELDLEEKQLEESMKKVPVGDKNVVSINQVTTTIEKKTTIKAPK